MSTSKCEEHTDCVHLSCPADEMRPLPHLARRWRWGGRTLKTVLYSEYDRRAELQSIETIIWDLTSTTQATDREFHPSSRMRYASVLFVCALTPYTSPLMLARWEDLSISSPFPLVTRTTPAPAQGSTAVGSP